MGSCFSCILECCGKQESTSQFGDTGDRTQLIDPANDGDNVQRMNGENYYNKYLDPVFPKKSEEHSDLNKILQEMATNVIDVASLGSHSLEQHDYRERMSFYMNKMRTLNLSKSITKLPKRTILQDVPNPERVLLSPMNVSCNDLDFIFSVLNQIDDALDNEKLENIEELIIPFQVQN